MRNLYNSTRGMDCAQIGPYSLYFKSAKPQFEEDDLDPISLDSREYHVTAELILNFLIRKMLNEMRGILYALDLFHQQFHEDFILLLDCGEVNGYTFSLTKGFSVFLGKRDGEFFISDKLDRVLVNTDHVLSLEPGVMAEMHEDGSCLFRDQKGERLNQEYLNLIKSEYVKLENKPKVNEKYSILFQPINHKDFIQQLIYN